MHLIRYAQPDDMSVRIGVLDGEIVRPVDIASMGALLSLSLASIRDRLKQTGADRPVGEVVLLAPVDGQMEVWAAGVTYARSRLARMEESQQSDIYDLIYGADRPELFFKSTPWRVVTHGQPIAIRSDSLLNVPEAELAVVANAYGEIIGYLVCDDVSSRSIEAENPLYLPQAKIYAGSCALSSGVRPAWEVDGTDLVISVEVLRGSEVVWADATSTSQLRRRPAELVDFLYREQSFPQGVVLSTGTGLVPQIEFTLVAGDIVSIAIAGVGNLRNHVLLGQEFRQAQASEWSAGADPSRAAASPH